MNGPDGEPSGDGKPPAAMVGTWTFQSVTVDSAAADLATVMDWVPGTIAARINVQANGAYVYEEVDAGGGQLWFESGFLFVDAGEIDINVQLDSSGPVNEMTVATFTLTGGTLTLQQVEQGSTIVFTLTM